MEYALYPYKADQNQVATTSQTRIDVVLGLYEAIIDRLEKALAALRGDDRAALKHQVAACALGLTGLAGASEGRGEDVALSLRRVYRVRCGMPCRSQQDQSQLRTGRTAHCPWQLLGNPRTSRGVGT